MSAVASKLVDEPKPQIWTKKKTPNGSRHLYENIFIWRNDLKRIRDLEHQWRMSRVQVIRALLNMAPSHPELRPVQLDLPGWNRLEDLAHRLDVPLDELVTRVLGLVSRCSDAELLSLISPSVPEQS